MYYVSYLMQNELKNKLAFNGGYLCSFLLQTATLKLGYVVVATVNKLVY